jgi:hypothetical protein
MCLRIDLLRNETFLISARCIPSFAVDYFGIMAQTPEALKMQALPA